MNRRLAFQLASNELAQHRRVSLADRRLYRMLAGNAIMAECVDGIVGDTIATTDISGPSLPAAVVMTAIGDGALAEFFQRVFQWLLDEENRAKLLELIKFFLSLGSLFGGL